MSPRQVYKKFENTELWIVIDKAVQALVDNGDLLEQTQRAYIVGYLCKSIAATRGGKPADRLAKRPKAGTRRQR